MSNFSLTPVRSAFQPIALIVALVAAFPAAAQKADSTLDPVVVTATRNEQKLSEVLSDTLYNGRRN